MSAISRIASWIKAKWAFRRVPGLAIEVSEYHPTPKQEMIDNANKLFIKILNGGTTLDDRTKACDELAFLEATKANIQEFLSSIEDIYVKDDLRMGIDMGIYLGRKALGRDQNSSTSMFDRAGEDEKCRFLESLGCEGAKT
jgi:hypothetical protein